MAPFLLLAIGLLTIFLEFYMPGGILAVLGSLIIIGSVVLFAVEYESPLLVVLYTIGVVVLIVYLFKFTLHKIRHSKKGFYSNDAQEGFVASTFDKTAIGKVGTVESDLKPGGHILLNGKKLSANSQSGYIAKGQKVLVVGGEGDILIVKQFIEEN